MRPPHHETIIAREIAAEASASCGHHPQTILDPLDVIQEMCLDDTDKGREAFTFSKIKQLVRKAGARAREELVEAIGRALAAVTPDDAASWFTHAGYRSQDQSL